VCFPLAPGGPVRSSPNAPAGRPCYTGWIDFPSPTFTATTQSTLPGLGGVMSIAILLVEDEPLIRFAAATSL